jgi:hypothetical protein
MASGRPFAVPWVMMAPMKTARRHVAVLAILALYAALALTQLGGLRWDSDEGINWAKGRLVGDAWLGRGHARLYREIWSDQPPLYTLATALPLAKGAGLAPARSVTVAFALLGLLSAAVAARQLALSHGARDGLASAAGIAAMLMLAVAPNFWWASRAAMIGLPAFSCGALAMGLGLVYARSGRRRDLAASAAALGASLLLKLQMAYLGPLLAVLVLARGAGRYHTPLETPPGLRHRRTATDLAILTILGLGPLCLAALHFGPLPFWDQVFGSYLSTREQFAVDWRGNLGMLGIWLRRDNRGLAVLVAAGLLLLWRDRPGPDPAEKGADARRLVALAYSAWLALTILTPLQHAPLWIKDHFEPLLLALAPGAGLAAATGAAAGLDLLRRRPGARLPIGPVDVAALLGLAIYLGLVPRLLAVDRALSSARSYDNDGAVTAPGDDAWRSQQRKEDSIRAAALWLQAHSGPDDYVATDHQLVAAWADRRVAPPLAAFSSRAVEIGAFDDAALIDAVERYRVPAVLLWDAEIAAFPKFRDWIAAHCGPPQIDLGSDRFGFVCGRSTLGPSDARTAPIARFRSADLLGHAQDWHQGRLELRLFWQAREPSPAPLSVAVHLMDAQGRKVAQHDGTPAEGGQPTDEWTTGQLVIDLHDIELPPGAVGPFRAEVGLYDPQTGARERRYGLETVAPLGDSDGNPVSSVTLELGRP